MEMYVMGAAALVVVVTQGLSLWLTRQQRRGLNSLGERICGLTSATTLLTESTESAIRDVLNQLERQATINARASNTSTSKTRRVTGAARRGLTVKQIAAAEQMSEGEVRLRAKLAAPPDPAKAHDALHERS
jgi:hypothetical protein